MGSNRRPWRRGPRSVGALCALHFTPRAPGAYQAVPFRSRVPVPCSLLPLPSPLVPTASAFPLGKVTTAANDLIYRRSPRGRRAKKQVAVAPYLDFGPAPKSPVHRANCRIGTCGPSRRLVPAAERSASTLHSRLQPRLNAVPRPHSFVVLFGVDVVDAVLSRRVGGGCVVPPFPVVSIGCCVQPGS